MGTEKYMKEDNIWNNLVNTGIANKGIAIALIALFVIFCVICICFISKRKRRQKNIDRNHQKETEWVGQHIKSTKRKKPCTDCGQTKNGKMYEENGLFYCRNCWNKYQKRVDLELLEFNTEKDTNELIEVVKETDNDEIPPPPPKEDESSSDDSIYKTQMNFLVQEIEEEESHRTPRGPLYA